MKTNPTLRSARPADRPFLKRLLDESDSPHVDPNMIFESLYLFEDSGERLGVIGLEVCETAGLVRTAVIKPSSRGMGWGTEMCNYLLREARKQGLTELYLLTTTAADFFSAIEFTETDRDTVPAAIKRTPEFAEFCPEDAICMVRELVGDEATRSEVA